LARGRKRQTGGRILVVDDEQSMREFLEIALRRGGFDVTLAEDGSHALALLENQRFDLVITDLKMGDVSGLDVLHHVKSLAPQTEVVVVTAFATSDTAIEAMKAGAYDYLKKPFKVDEIRIVCQRALERHRLAVENRELRRRLTATQRFGQILGKSAAMRRVFELIDKVAPSRSNLLVTGESGTGKELVARSIHLKSSRVAGPFLAVNCGAIPSNLLESELFGHVKGAFTGADRDRPGMFRQAQGGTLLLDEVAELDVSLQVKLLRVLQERRIRPVGSDQDESVDVRVIAATNRDLVQLVGEGTFRDDLYYRLNVIEVRVPPLRERREDIPLLVNYFCDKYAEENGKVIEGMAAEAMKKLVGYSYPGNVRELENIIERAVILAAGSVIESEDVVDLVPAARSDAVTLEWLLEKGWSLDEALAWVEQRLIDEALQRTSGVRVEAARVLGISFRSFRYRLQKLTQGGDEHPSDSLGESGQDADPGSGGESA